MLCNPPSHDWELEQIESAKDIIQTSTLKFRCKKCNATLRGAVKR